MVEAGGPAPARPAGWAARLADGVRLALTTFTVARLRGGRVDREAAQVAMVLAPAVGLLLGALLSGLAVGLTGLGASALVAAVAVVAGAALLTRGLHLDGLADTADGLGAYAGRDRSLEIMRRPDIGPFGVVAIVLALLAQVAAASAVLERPWLPAMAGIVAAVATGRVAVALGCQRGVPAARPEGLGAMVAGTVPGLVAGGWAVAVAALAVVAVPGRPWQGSLAVALGVAAALLLRRHVVRRLGGVTGDALGAMTEIAVTITFIVISI